MHAARPVVLPAAFICDLVIRSLAGDEVVHAAPLGRVQRMDESAGRILPFRRPFRADRILGPAVEVPLARVEVGITCKHLKLAIDQQLVGGEPGRHVGTQDPVLVGRPLQALERHSAADHRLLLAIGLVNDRRLLGAGIIGCQDQRFRQIVCAATEIDLDRFRAATLVCVLAGFQPRPVQRGERPLQRPRIRIAPARRDITIARQHRPTGSAYSDTHAYRCDHAFHLMVAPGCWGKMHDPSYGRDPPSHSPQNHGIHEATCGFALKI